MSSPPAASDSIIIHTPGSDHPSLADGPTGFDRTWFMGQWRVEWSTLPMWKDKRDVVIEYEPVASGSKINTTFQSVVKYHKKTAGEDSSPSTVKGTETLSTGANGATFDWKGSGMLFFVHSHWEVLGYGTDPDSGLEWAVTYFSKTLFTPAGIDIYIRRKSDTDATDVPPEKNTQLRNMIVQAIQANNHEAITKLAKDGFDVPGKGV
ncbi:hypothetical protein BD324DRAFT_626599 [Kockovaella imperatae]|uniref:Calycin-like protein n=1 Tax=Kockovaella imperatae TaxID=4999 RepID=A0A1Y1UGI7_9TREE|nr:hypothetical protein BD324DRAFT_626599 [Kockovaella imperatae]ORX36624.1 hypothetical protein BD324DRAFT_626599 [Kockovaella imperatae]